MLKYIPWPVRVVIGAVFWTTVVVPVNVLYGMALGAREGWQESINLARTAWKNKG